MADGFLAVKAEKSAGQIRFVSMEKIADSRRLPEWVERMSDSAAEGELVVMCSDAAQTVFYPLDVPAIDDERIDEIVGTQSESLLPLPVSQAATAWRFYSHSGGKQQGYLGIVRKTYLNELCALTGSHRPGSVLVQTVGLVHGWRACCQSDDRRSVLIWCRHSDCLVVLCEAGKLICSTAVDYDSDSGSAVLYQDVCTAMEAMGADRDMPAYLGGSPEIAAILNERMGSSGRQIHPFKAVELRQGLAIPAIPGRDEVLSWLEPVGAAIACFEESIPEYDFLRKPVYEKTAKIRLQRAVAFKSLAATVLLGVLFLLVLYWLSGRELQALDVQMQAPHQKTTADMILSRQEFRQRIAKVRPDVKELLTLLGTCAGKDVILDNFSFKKGQPVRITAKAGSFEQVYQFQKKLAEQAAAGISDIKLITPTADEKSGKVQFTMTFGYKGFGR